MKTLRSVIVAIATVLLSFDSALALAEPRHGGTLTFLVEPEPPALVGIAHTAGPTQKVTAKVTEGLLAYDENLNPVPQLATEWSVSDDGLRYTFKLRAGVKWHDGVDFTSADVAHSIKLLQQYHPRGRGTFKNVTAVETPDPLTAVIMLSKPAPYLLKAFAASESPIVPKHIYGDSDPATNPATSAPIGTGPFVFKEWVRGSYILYERNPNYWDKPKPYVDKLIVKFVPDAAARTAAFETGEVDIGGETPVPLSEIERLKALPQLGFETKGYNYGPSVTRIEFNLSNKYLKDLRVRRAIAHAIDRNLILNTVYYGYGIISPTPISPLLTQYFDANTTVYEYNPAKAEQLLDEAGFKRGADGIRFHLDHDYLPYGDSYKRTADYLAQALRKVGIDITIRSQDFATYIKRVYTDRQFDFTNNSMSNLFDPTLGVQRLYWSKNFKQGVPFSNGSGWSNPAADAALEAAAVELDEAKRKEYFLTFQRLVVDEVPDITLLTLNQFTIFNKRVHDHTIGAGGLNENFADVWIDQ
ncbi:MULTISPECIES: ABC transporter substrate-binding protein [unclassified Mesorhizobium]|uniref:ABC transporter substrate-binding protein n=1 Tax=unclassified Mesorhizobium TaxID=325217 RepID=UPI000FCC7D87|nr:MULTISPECIES: ABC transporter substrate-binding protein [unclassified Mesorhizobium]RUW32882.1 ABC transporter substrate-binding protein [Mesorhizobium sp. M1E.F.Ca.ET.041.01.1.1]RWD91840.1 MAG: ABC transporter substrate-binding protein [Mesorhizobium sp.]RWD95803.1 MAG: ABC transporter substrate-binding protein [Mesorhizobium sp.]